MRRGRKDTPAVWIFQRILVAFGATVLTTLFFLVLPIIQEISKSDPPDRRLRPVDSGAIDPPDTIEEEELEEPEEEPEEEPPELEEQTETLDLAMLELALNPSFGDGWGGDFALDLGSFNRAGGGAVDELFSLAELDQKPRILYEAAPVLNGKLRKRVPASVTVVFVVNQDGRVENPIAQKSTDPVFEKPVISAIRKWKFEPGKKNGKPVSFRMRRTITFPEE